MSVACKRRMQTESRSNSLRLSQQFKEHSARRGVPETQLAIAWVLNNRLVTGVIGGPLDEVSALSRCMGSSAILPGLQHSRALGLGVRRSAVRKRRKSISTITVTRSSGRALRQPGCLRMYVRTLCSVHPLA